jgi:putative nucleotidyltransferase with HDIG domain
MTTKTHNPLITDRQQSFSFWAKRALLFLAAFVVATLLIVVERQMGFQTQEFKVGDPALRTLFAPFSVTLVDEQATDTLRRKSGEHVPPVYSINTGIAKESFRRLDRFMDLLQKVKDGEMEISKIENPPLNISGETIKDLVYRLPLDEVGMQVDHLLMHYFGKGIFDKEEKTRLLAGSVGLITLYLPDLKKERNEKTDGLQTLQDVQNAAESLLPPEIAKDKSLRNAVLEIFRAAVVPNTVLNDAETDVRRRKAAEQVPPVEVKIKKDELIVQRGMLVTPEQEWKIDGIQKKQMELQIINKFLAVAILVFSVYFLFFIFFCFYDRKTLASGKTIVLVHTVLLTTLGLCKLACMWPGSSPYLMPAAVAPVLLVLLVSPRLGMLSSALMAILTAPLSNFAPEAILAVLVSGVNGSFVAIHVRRRAQFLKLGAAVGMMHALVLFSYHVFREYPIMASLAIAAPGLANGFLITMPLVFLLLPIFEWLFNIVTDVTLLELSDLNHPLLKRMIVEAPGTYHHSLVVSSLAESACEAIGANGLLARVGAYFHDIGKIARGQIFVENQTNQFLSRHADMPPEVSCRLIKNHVQDGLELGRKHKIKDRILQFISEHQGTGIIYYFYRKAIEMAPSGQTVRIEDFRYDGPRPQSRETAVVHLADSVEAASRAVEEPTPESVRQLVRRIIQDKLEDGQLDECDLTLRDLRKIEDVFVYNLTAIMHTRMSHYSQQDTSGELSEAWEEKILSKTNHHPPANG